MSKQKHKRSPSMHKYHSERKREMLTTYKIPSDENFCEWCGKNIPVSNWEEHTLSHLSEESLNLYANKLAIESPSRITSDIIATLKLPTNIIDRSKEIYNRFEKEYHGQKKIDLIPAAIYYACAECDVKIDFRKLITLSGVDEGSTMKIAFEIRDALSLRNNKRKR